MILSKSFGYALRGILYVAMVNDNKDKVQLHEIANQLMVPRHFLAKVMKQVVRKGILDSVRGPHGGFSVNENTLKTKLVQIAEISGDNCGYESCILRLRKCNAKNPCPMHSQVELLRKQWLTLLTSTTLGDLLRKDQPEFINSIAAI